MAARLIEIELRVRDVARSAAFYRDLVGVAVGDIETHAADSEPHVHATASSPPATSALRSAISRQRTRGSSPRMSRSYARPTNGRGGAPAAYRDPDGNTVFLTEARR